MRSLFDSAACRRRHKEDSTDSCAVNMMMIRWCKWEMLYACQKAGALGRIHGCNSWQVPADCQVVKHGAPAWWLHLTAR